MKSFCLFTNSIALIVLTGCAQSIQRVDQFAEAPTQLAMTHPSAAAEPAHSTPEPTKSHGPAAPPPVEVIENAERAAHTAEIGDTAVALAATSDDQPSSDHLAIWNDPAFQRQFANSYIAETEIEPSVTADERETMMKVLEHIANEDMGKAAALIERNRGDAASAVFDFTLANIYFQQDQLDSVAAAYEVAASKFPKFRRAWRNLALIHVRQGDYERALTALIKVVELGGSDAITFGLLGYCYSNLDNNLSAESAYRMANMLDPETLDWKLGLARSFFRQERFADAAALLAQLIDEHPDRSDFWLLQANAFIGLGQPMRAAENYELVDRMGGSTAESLNMLADIYTNEELFDLAVDSYIRAMELDRDTRPDRAIRASKVLTSRGALSETKRLVEYIDSAFGRQLSELDRKDLLKLRARIAVAEGAGDEQARVLEQIVEIDPLDGEALILLGQYYGREGDVETATFYFERAASLDDFEADAKVRHAQLLVNNSRYDEAIPLLRRAQQINPRENIQSYLEQIERLNKSR